MKLSHQCYGPALSLVLGQLSCGVWQMWPGLSGRPTTDQHPDSLTSMCIKPWDVCCKLSVRLCMSLETGKAVFLNCQACWAEAANMFWNFPRETARWANTWTPSSWLGDAQAQAHCIRVMCRPPGHGGCRLNSLLLGARKAEQRWQQNIKVKSHWAGFKSCLYH